MEDQDRLLDAEAQELLPGPGECLDPCLEMLGSFDHLRPKRRKYPRWRQLGALFGILLLGGLVLHGAKRSVFSFPSVLSVALRDPVLTAPVGVEAEPTSGRVGPKTGRTAYVMLAHYLNQSVEAEFEHLLSDLGGADVYLLYDDTHHPLPNSYDIRQFTEEGASPPFYGRIFILNDRDLRKISPSFESAWDNIQTLLVAFYRAVILPQPQYDHVWFLESDVRCNGNYKKTFEKSEGLVEDFLAFWAVGRMENWGAALHEWNWHRLSGVLMEERYGAFLPVMRLSRSALQMLSDNASGDVTGFCEVYIPTVIHVNGGTVGNLPTGMFGEFQYRPQMTQAEYEALPGKAEDVLYHPVI